MIIFSDALLIYFFTKGKKINTLINIISYSLAYCIMGSAISSSLLSFMLVFALLLMMLLSPVFDTNIITGSAISAQYEPVSTYGADGVVADSAGFVSALTDLVGSNDFVQENTHKQPFFSGDKIFFSRSEYLISRYLWDDMSDGFTISLFLNHGGSDGVIISMDSDYASKNNFLSLFVRMGRLNVKVKQQSGFVRLTDNDLFIPDRWSDVRITYNKEGIIELFVDDVLKDSKKISFVPESEMIVCLGADCNGERGWDGIIRLPIIISGDAGYDDTPIASTTDADNDVGVSSSEVIDNDVGVSSSEVTSGEIPVTFTLPSAGYVTLVIDYTNGTRARNLIQDTWFDAGVHTINWDGYDVGTPVNRVGNDEQFDIERHLVDPGTYVCLLYTSPSPRD